jgi:triacylglycerol lipase
MDASSLFARLDAPIVLAHGLFGFTRIGIRNWTFSAYFRGIPAALEAAGNRVLVTRVPPIAGVEERARRLGMQIDRAFPGQRVHLIGHSMGGLDARRLLAEPAWHDRVLSLTTIATPHLGTTVADFAKLRVGRVFRLMSSLGIDPQGCLDVTRRSARRFHRMHPEPTDIPCFCIAGDPPANAISWPLRRIHSALEELEGPNDGLVSVASATAFGTPLPAWPLDHLRQLNWLLPGDLKTEIPAPSAIGYYTLFVTHLASLGFGFDSPTSHAVEHAVEELVGVAH